MHLNIFPGPDNPSHCSKELMRSMLHSYIWTHCPHALAFPSSCCGLDDARESQTAQRFGSQQRYIKTVPCGSSCGLLKTSGGAVALPTQLLNQGINKQTQNKTV